MRAKTIIWLAAMTVLILAAAFYVVAERERQSAARNQAGPLFPGLLDQANAVAGITVVRGEERAAINRDGDRWQLTDKGGYPAKFETVKSTILGLGEIETLAPKTDDPARHGALGLNGPDAADDAAIQVTLLNRADEVLASVLLGNPAAGGDNRRYVRKAGDDQTWLATVPVTVSPDPLAWVESTITNILRERVRRLQIVQPDLSTLTISRAQGDPAQFEVEGVPAGMKVADKTVVARMGGVLSGLRMEDIAAAADLPFGDAPETVSVIQTFYGLQVTARTIEHEGRSWTRFEALFDRDLMVEPYPGRPVNPDTEDPEQQAKDLEERLAAVEAEAKELNDRLNGWAFVVPAHKLEQLTQPMIGLIEPEEEAPASNGEVPVDPVSPSNP